MTFEDLTSRAQTRAAHTMQLLTAFTHLTPHLHAALLDAFTQKNKEAIRITQREDIASREAASRAADEQALNSLSLT